MNCCAAPRRSGPVKPPGAAAVEAAPASAAAAAEEGEPPETMTLKINGDDVTCSADPGVNLRKCFDSPVFQQWAKSVDVKFLIKHVLFQSVDMFGPRVGFLKFKADCADRASGQFLPGIVFMRGGSVGILVVLVSEQTGQEFTVAVKQPRLPTGNFDSVEIPAGMLDDEGNFAGKAAEELQEETGISVLSNDLLDLNKLLLDQPAARATRSRGETNEGVYLSPGGSDEFMRLFLYRKVWKQEAIEALEGKLGGLRDHGELISLSIIPYEDLIKVPDGKTLCAIAMYDRVHKKLPELMKNFSS